MSGTFLATENSNYSGRPVHLYQFSQGNTQWLYTSADRDVTFNGDQYLAMDAISDDGISQSGEAVTDAFVVHLPASAALAQRYRGSGPSDPVSLTVWRFHYGDDNAVAVWVGQVTNVTEKQSGRVDITCQLLITSLNRQGLRLSYERGCPHALYDRNCRVDKNAYKVVAVIQGLTGDTVTSTTFGSKPSGYFAGGYIEWETEPDTWDRRGVEAHEGNVIELLGQSDGLGVGLQIFIYPGCYHSPGYCQSVFNNLPNYGGIPCMPGLSPFDGRPIF